MKKIVVGMSGGVDSAVAAFLLQEQGYEVIGLFMRNWDSTINNDVLGNPNIDDDICPQEGDYNDALKVCERLNIPLHRVDFVKEYWDHVFTYFLDELKRGRTPNPDVMCNKYIKFDLFTKEAKKYGAKFIATGHYARIKDNKLLKGLDHNKDQSYFLCQLSNKQLINVLFPVGELDKTEVRKIAKKNNLIVSDKKDSTGICFIGERNFSKFLKNYLPSKEGSIFDIDTKEKLGIHYGLMNYTIGQRKGLGLGGSDKKLYVVGKDMKSNILFVGNGSDHELLFSDKAILESMNWINNKKEGKLKAKFRYRQQDNDIELEILKDNNIKVTYPQTIKAVTPGQICCIYDGDICLGGGIIKEVYKDNKKLVYFE